LKRRRRQPAGSHADSPPDASPVCIAGMHRSGTSMVTKLLHQCGLNLGEAADLAEPGIHNPDGYWENLRFVEINDDLLDLSGGGWDLVPGGMRAGSSGPKAEGHARLRGRAQALIARFAACPAWGWKDPRNSITLPFWDELCPTLRVVVCVRNPLEVALSLRQRNDFSYAHGLSLWLKYNRRLLAAAAPARRMLTHYDAYFEDPAAEVRRLADFAGLRPAEAAVQACAAVVRPDLRHNRFTAADLLKARLADEVLDLYARLCEEAGRPEPALRERAKGRGRAARAAEAEPRAEVLVDRRAVDAELMRRELSALRPELRRRDALAQDLQARLSDATERATRLDQAVTDVRTALEAEARTAAHLRLELAARDAAARELQLRLEHAEQRAQKAESLAATLAAAMRMPDEGAAGSKDSHYRQLMARVREAARRVVPAGATVAVVSRGDDRLLDLGGRGAWHFPRDDRGVYAGYHPADSAAAVNHLEALRAKGAQFLLLPSTAFWWLEHYGAFRRHLDERYSRVWSDGDCVVYRLGDGSEVAASADAAEGTFVQPDLAPDAALPLQHAAADVVVCVHNALDDVKRCLESVVRHTRMPYTLLLVDDGSGEETRRYLEQFARAQGATLLRNDAAGGYTAAANRGLRESSSPLVVLLNSDTVVGREWLDRMIACAESDPAIGLVGPLSNTASWQSAPGVMSGGDWARNTLPAGVSPAEMARQVAASSGRVYPRLPFLNGFCLLLKREVVRDLGEFDEATFAGGYGEENDYCLRAGKAGWELAVADDVYVFHRQSASYSDERRRTLCERADAALEAKHGRPLIDSGVAACRFGRVIEGVRARCAVLEERQRLIEDGRARWEGRRVLFVLPVAEANGGGNVVLQEAAAMRRMGVDVRVLNLEHNRAGFERGYPDNTLPVVYARNGSDVARLAAGYDAVVATWSGSVGWLAGVSSDTNGSSNDANGDENGNGNGNGSGHNRCVGPRRGPVLGYYVQDFEPEFYTRGSDDFRSALASYTRHPHLVRFTKTQWNRDAVLRHAGAVCAVVGPSVDLELHRPRRRQGGEPAARPVWLAAMVRPATPRRSPKLTMAVLGELAKKWGDRVEIILFGCSPGDPGLAALPQGFHFRLAGELTRGQTAALLNEVDVFADFSAFQAMGLTALEAMACGAAVIVPKEGGADSYARGGENCLVVDTASEAACLAAADRLVAEPDLRSRLQRQAIHDVCAFHPERAAHNILQVLLTDPVPEARADAHRSRVV
jgi:GT2 family glycosyltransferase